MKFRFLLSVILFLSFLAAVRTICRDIASAQEPRRWYSGDTLWLEIDSLPLLPSDKMLYDSSYLWLLPTHERLEFGVDAMPHRNLPPRMVFDYSIPYWSVYRRSVTVWGITFSTGQASPYSPYPAGESQSANVLSFPLQRPR